MIAHPLLLFLGYAGFTVPFAMMIGALVAGRKDNEWLAATRRWILTSWLFLTIGIILGAQWAYVELGWGGLLGLGPGRKTPRSCPGSPAPRWFTRS
jgi:cytochrome c-type biogenesis protein CcmF